MAQLKQIHELAGQQDDEVAEDALASLFTDLPVREIERPEDTRRSTAWAMGYDGGSRIWLSFSEPFDDNTVKIVKQRAEAALAWLVPVVAKSVEVEVIQVNYDTLRMGVRIFRPRNKTIELAFSLVGGSGA